ncbi:MAG TPA: c-type cytochrome [Pseudolabrys sp.]|jgi:mono/diheme cytochrome c family protein|nr:c-type cytochrome [Pseudolabrys sp.]
MGQQRALLLAAAIVFTGAATDGGQAQAQPAAGQALLEQHCAMCHAIRKTGTSPHPAAPPLRQISRTYDLDKFTEILQRGIIAGHPDMPPFRFSRRDARAITSYLRSIEE